MAYYVKKNGQLEKIAGNVSISQADWNETDDRKFTRIKNKPDTLNTLDEIMSNENEHSLAGANALKELTTTVAGMGSELIKTSAKVNLLANSDLGINVVEKGENIHLDDSSDNKVAEMRLYGKSIQGTTTGKNLIPYPYKVKTNPFVTNGVTFTDNKDGTITVNGTATDKVTYVIHFRGEGNLILKNGSYILSGCPEGGNASKYSLRSNRLVGSSGVDYTNYDTGNGALIELNGDDLNSDKVDLGIFIHISSGTTVPNLTFKPMLRLASISDPTYEPYTNGATPRPDYPQEIEVSGESYNLIHYPYEITTMTVNGITWTDLGDGRIMANGTATETSSFDKFLGNQTEGLREKLQSYGEVILTGCPSGGGSSTFRLFVWGAYNKGEYSANDYGSGATFTFDNNDKGFGFSAQVMKGVKVENLIFKPMLRKASVKNDRYMPYGKGSVEVKSVGKNLLPYPYYDSDKTSAEVTFKVLEDGSIVANGTSNSTSNSLFLACYRFLLKKGDYVLSGCPSGGSTNTYRLRLGYGDENTFMKDELGNGVNFTLDKDTSITVLVQVFNGYKAENIVFKPMIRLASVKDATYEPYKETLVTIPTPNGLAGIPVDSGGNYTDSNGQQWICDEIVKYADGSGEYIQRIEKKVFDGVSNVCTWVGSSNNGTETLWQINLGENTTMPNAVFISSKYILCDKFKVFSYTHGSDNFAYGCRQGSSKAICCLLKESDGVTDVTSANEWLKNNNVKVYYIINPIRTPLTSEEIAETEKLYTFYPATNISNDADCGMKVKYIADNKAYVDKNLELQMKAQEQTMMSMFLLLPDEMQAAMIENDTNNLLKESGV